MLIKQRRLTVTDKRQIHGEKFNVAELVQSAISTAERQSLNLGKARTSLEFYGNQNPTDEQVARYARETAVLEILARKTGANFGGQIGKIDFSTTDRAIADVNAYLSRRNAAHRARWTANRR
jgi:hypothetical protein